MTDPQPLLSVRGLCVEFMFDARINRVVDNLDLDVWSGETVGLVGETGCGKSVTALSIMGLIDRPGHIAAGEILFDGQDLRLLNAEALRQVRGAGISMIFQEPMTSLDPSFTIGSQIGEVLWAHQMLRASDAQVEARRLLEQVRMPHAQRVLQQYPFELSGGMRQRVMIALALACHPKFLIADEPTTALDVTVQAQILALLDELRRETGTAMLLITHDLGIVAENCDRVYVMYAGRVAERSGIEELFEAPLHPYTRGLIGAVPDLNRVQARLAMIPGEVARPGARLAGCHFAPRCAHAMPVCSGSPPPLAVTAGDRAVACYLYT